MRTARVCLAFLILGASIAALVGCATTSKANPQAFEQTVKDTWVRYSNLWMDGDVNGWIQLWDAGGVQLPPGSPMKMSVSEIKKSSEAAQAAFQFKNFVIRVSGTFVDENFGFAYGNYSYTIVPRAGGDAINADGKYETIFKRQPDGSWKIFRDCFNSNAQ